MDDPFAMGTAYGLKDKLEDGGIKTVVDEVYPPNTTDFGSIAAQDRGLATPTWWSAARSTRTRVNLIVALQQLNYQPKMAAFSTAPTNAEFPEAIGDKTEGILSPTGYTPDATYPRTRSSSSTTPSSTARRRPRTRPTPGPPARWSPPRSRRPTAPTRRRSASRS